MLGSLSKNSRVGHLLRVVSSALFIVATIQLGGGLLDSVVRGDYSFRVISPIPLYVLAIAIRYAASRLPEGRPLRFHVVWLIAATAAVFYLQHAVHSQWFSFKREPVPELGIWTYESNAAYTSALRTGHTFRVTTDHCGYRQVSSSKPTPPAAPDTTLPTVALVGDSFVFGTGVDDHQSLPAMLQQALSEHCADEGCSQVRVVNIGVEGSAMSSFAGMIAHAIQCYSPQLVAVLLKADDFTDNDVHRRLTAYSESLLQRLLVLTGYEAMINVFIQSMSLYGDFGIAERVSAVRWLDAIRKASGERPLVFVTLLDRGYLDVFRDWHEALDDTYWLDLSAYPEVSSAERIEGDGHWTESGNRSVANLIAPAVKEALDGTQRRFLGKEIERPYHKVPIRKPLPDLLPMNTDLVTIQSVDSERTAYEIAFSRPGRPPLEVKAFSCGDSRYFGKAGEICFAISPGQETEREDTFTVRNWIDTVRRYLDDNDLAAVDE